MFPLSQKRKNYENWLFGCFGLFFTKTLFFLQIEKITGSQAMIIVFLITTNWDNWAFGFWDKGMNVPKPPPPPTHHHTCTVDDIKMKIIEHSVAKILAR